MVGNSFISWLRTAGLPVSLIKSLSWKEFALLWVVGVGNCYVESSLRCSRDDKIGVICGSLDF